MNLTSLGWQTRALSLISRVVFAAVLLPWFLIGGVTRIAGLSLSVGPDMAGLPLSLGAYQAWLPGRITDLSLGLPVMPMAAQAYVGVMVLLELVLPVMIVIGWRVRIAVPLLTVHQTIYWITALPMVPSGRLFDASPFDLMPDQLLLWAMLLAPLVLFGAGPVSLDALRYRRRLPRG